MTADKNEKIILDKKTTSFAFGLTDSNPLSGNDINISDLFDLKIEYIQKIRGRRIESITPQPRNCMISDFIDINGDSDLWKNIQKLNCLDKEDLKESPNGTFTDPYFSYYIITVKSKYVGNETHDKIIDDYLARYDCKLLIYYTDISLDLFNFRKPFSYIINSLFLQLNPTIIQKKDIYYMNYYLKDDTRLFQLFSNDDEKYENYRKETVFSRAEDYFVYKGVNRTFKYYDDIYTYAKMYIRADNRKMVIKRNYQDLFEFYNEKSSLWLSVYLILGFFFSLYDRENASHSISKKLFYFEGIKDNKFNKFKELKEMVNKIQENEIYEQKNKIQVSPYTTRNNTTSKSLADNITRKNSKATIKTDIPKDKNKIEELINYENFNLFEMIGSHKLFFCKSKSFKSKVNLFNQAKNIIDNKLDIIYYIRKMILLEIINKIHLENKNIINFLSRPIIYLNDTKDRKKKYKNEINDKVTNFSIDTEYIKEQRKIEEKMNINPIEVLKEYVEDETYKTAYKFNPDILTEKIGKLLRKQEKTVTEIKLISYLKEQLKGIH